MNKNINKTTLLIAAVGVAAVLATGGYLLLAGDTATKKDDVNKPAVGERLTNGQALQDGNATAIVTEAEVKYFEGANGYFARPAAEGEYPGVVMIHENRGLNSGVKLMAEQLAKEGYLVLAVDLF